MKSCYQEKVPSLRVLPVRMGQSKDSDSGFWSTFSLSRLLLRLMVDFSCSVAELLGPPKGRQSSQ